MISNEDFEELFKRPFALALDPSISSDDLTYTILRRDYLNRQVSRGLSLPAVYQDMAIDLIMKDWGDYYAREDVLGAWSVLQKCFKPEDGFYRTTAGMFVAINPALEAKDFIERIGGDISCRFQILEAFLRYNAAVSPDSWESFDQESESQKRDITYLLSSVAGDYIRDQLFKHYGEEKASDVMNKIWDISTEAMQEFRYDDHEDFEWIVSKSWKSKDYELRRNDVRQVKDLKNRSIIHPKDLFERFMDNRMDDNKWMMAIAQTIGLASKIGRSMGFDPFDHPFGRMLLFGLDRHPGVMHSCPHANATRWDER